MKRGRVGQSLSVTPGTRLQDLLVLTETEEGPKVVHGLDLEAVELVLIPDLKGQGVRDSQGHITMSLSGGFIEVLLIVKGEARVLELMAGLVTALTQRMTTGGQGLVVVIQADLLHTLARKKN